MPGKEISLNTQSDKWEQIELTSEVIKSYGLSTWVDGFNLMTAGYRDQLDPLNAFNPGVAINILTIAILGEAKARVFKKNAKDEATLHVHVGGETRPHTQEFIRILSRIYAAHGFVVHLRSKVKTTPIWYSSFGVFYEGYQSGDNLTASHSQYFKGGWKPIDGLGKQIVEQESDIIKQVKNIVQSNAVLKFAPWKSSDNILHDFDVTRVYTEYQKTVVPQKSIDEIKQVGKDGFKCSVCTVGGSMKATTEPIFNLFKITTGKEGMIQYFYDEEDSEYHQIGQIDGENFGVDPTKSQIYKNIGAQEKLDKKNADIVFIWDPDGDRFNMVTTAPSDKARYFIEQGLEVDEKYPNIVYFTPNQIFFMLTAFRIENLMSTGGFKHDWFLASSVTTTRAMDELAAYYKIPVVHVKVGFKYWGTFATWLEKRTDFQELVPADKMALNEIVRLGEKPRLLIMCEESGGAVFGGSELLENKNGTQRLVGMREKDGFQFGLLSLALSAFLFNKKQSFAEFYCELLNKYKIKHKYFHRHDEKLYDESLTGPERHKAKAEAEIKKLKVMDFFKDLSKRFESGDLSAIDVQNIFKERLPEGAVEIPVPTRLCLIGESELHGTYIEFDSFWFVVRASGTDALIRYYIEGKSQDELEDYRHSFVNLQI
jgi:phosphomannomutase